MSEWVASNVSSLASTFVITIIIDGIKHLLTKAPMPKRNHYAKILRKTFRNVVENVDPAFWQSTTLGQRIQIQNNLIESLQSPSINKDEFLSVLRAQGLNKKSSEKIYQKVLEDFKKIVDKEAAKNPQVFNEIIISAIRKMEIQISQITNDLEVLKDEMPEIIHLITMMSKFEAQWDRIEGKVDDIQVCNKSTIQQNALMESDIKSIVEKVTAIEKIVSERPIVKPGSNIALTFKFDQTILESIKSSWLKRFEKQLYEGTKLIGDENYTNAQQKLSKLLADIDEERNIHVGDDKFLIRNDLSKIEVFCLSGLGFTYYHFKDYAKANEFYEKSIFLSKLLPINKKSLGAIHYWSGISYYSQREFEKAVVKFKEALRLSPSFSSKEHVHYHLANSCYYLKKYQEAIECYSKAINIDPNKAFIYNNRASTYADWGRLAEATRDYMKALEIDEDCCEAYYGLGTVSFELKHYEKSILEYSKAIDSNPSYAEAYNNRGVSNFCLERNEQSISDWKKAMEIDPSLAEPYINIGDAYRSLRQYPKAIENLNKAIELSPNSPCALHHRSWYFWETNQLDLALQDCNKAIELDPIKANLYNSRGCVHIEMGNYEKALVDFNQALAIDPDDALCYLNRGNAFLRLNQHSSAIQNYKKSIDKKPNNPEAYYNLGCCYSALGNPEEAIKNYTKSLELNNEFVSGYINRGFEFVSQKKYDLAITDQNQAIKLDSHNAAAYTNRGNAFFYKGDWMKALEDYTKSIEIDPKQAHAYYDRGNVYAKYLHQYDKAKVDFDKALEFDRNYANAYNSRGIAYYYLNDYEKSMKDYDRAIEIDPNQAIYYRNRGIVHLDRSEIDSAIEEYMHAIRLDYGDIESHVGLAVACKTKKEYYVAAREFKNAGILFTNADKENAICAFSEAFQLREVIENDDIIYCGIFLLILEIDDKRYLALRNLIKKKGIDEKALEEIWNLVLRKLKNEEISEFKVEVSPDRPDLKILFDYVVHF